MVNPNGQPLDDHLDDDRLLEPPLVDALHYERDADGFAITFIPSTDDEATRSIFLPRDSTEGRQVAANLYRIQQLIGGSRLERVVHGGGANYTLRLGGGENMLISSDAPDERWVPEVLNRLKQIAEVAEGAFNLLHAAGR